MRKDARENRARLIAAAGQIVSTRPDSMSVQLVAEMAGLSVATAYRSFSTLDELIRAYVLEVLVRLRDFSHDCPNVGKPLFEAVIGEWFRLLGEHGAGMVQVRSRRGYLERLHAGEPVISTARDAWERPIRAVLRSERINDDQFDYALSLYNVLFDPREILDLMAVGLSSEEVQRRLVSAYYGALRGWAEGTR